MKGRREKTQYMYSIKGCSKCILKAHLAIWSRQAYHERDLCTTVEFQNWTCPNYTLYVGWYSTQSVWGCRNAGLVIVQTLTIAHAVQRSICCLNYCIVCTLNYYYCISCVYITIVHSAPLWWSDTLAMRSCIPN